LDEADDHADGDDDENAVVEQVEHARVDVADDPLRRKCPSRSAVSSMRPRTRR
jgi:hypothetical protein